MNTVELIVDNLLLIMYSRLLQLLNALSPIISLSIPSSIVNTTRELAPLKASFSIAITLYVFSLIDDGIVISHLLLLPFDNTASLEPVAQL